MRLSDLTIGQVGIITGMGAFSASTQRLMELGVLEGEQISIVAIPPWGDPLEVEVGATRLSLRKSDAQLIEIELLPPVSS